MTTAGIWLSPYGLSSISFYGKAHMHQTDSSEAEKSNREALQDAAHIVHLSYSKAKCE